MNDPRSSNGRGGDAKQATTTVSDLGIEPGAWKDLGEVSRGQLDISKHPPASPATHSCTYGDTTAPLSTPHPCGVPPST